MFEARITASEIERDENGETINENHGWITPSWSMTEIYTSPNDIEAEKFDTLEEAIEWIESYIGEVDKKHVERGHYYAEDTHFDYETGYVYSYVGHVSKVA